MPYLVFWFCNIVWSFGNGGRQRAGWVEDKKLAYFIMLELILHPFEHCFLHDPLPWFKRHLLSLIKSLVFILNTTECYCYVIFIASLPKSSKLPKVCKNSSYASRTKHNSFQSWERVRSLTLSFLDLTSLILTQNICFNTLVCVLGNKGAFVSIAHAHKTKLSVSNHHWKDSLLNCVLLVWTRQTCVADAWSSYILVFP